MFKLLEKIGEYVAPVPKLPEEAFVFYWENVKAEHTRIIQEEFDLDDQYRLAHTKIRQNLTNMVYILIKEDSGFRLDKEADMLRQVYEKEFGPLKPCFEYMLENRVWEDLCALGLADRPSGMMKLIIDKIHFILKHIQHPLLPYKTVHQPLCQLVRVCVEVGCPQVKESLIALLSTIWRKLQSEPTQADFFYSEPTRGRPDSLVLFTALLPFMHKGTETGKLARATVLSIVKLGNEQITYYLAQQSPLCSHLVKHLVDCFNSAQTTDDYKYLCDQLLFCNALTMIELGRFPFLHGSHEIRDFDFTDITKSPNTSCLTKEILGSIKNEFLLECVKQALNQTSEVRVKEATCKVCAMLGALSETIMALQSPILTEFINMLIHVNDESISLDVETLQTKLIYRLGSQSSLLSISTLLLFAKLLELDSPSIIHNLVLQPLLERKHLVTIDDLNVGKNDTPFCTPPRKTKHEKEYIRPEEDARSSFLTQYQDSPRPPRSNKNIMKINEVDNVVSFERYLTDAQTKTAKRIAAFRTPNKLCSESALETKAEENVFQEGLFMTFLFDKLEGFLDSSFDSNVALTGVLAQIAQYPHEILHEYIFDEHKIKPEVRTLTRIVKDLWTEARLRADRCREFDQNLETVKSLMGISSDSVISACIPMEQMKFLQNFVLLQEFLKELASILQAKENLAQVSWDLNFN